MKSEGKWSITPHTDLNSFGPKEMYKFAQKGRRMKDKSVILINQKKD